MEVEIALVLGCVLNFAIAIALAARVLEMGRRLDALEENKPTNHRPPRRRDKNATMFD